MAGGGDPPPPESCNPESIKSRPGRSCWSSASSKCSVDHIGSCLDREVWCNPYTVPLSSWDQIRSSQSRIYSFGVGFNTTPSSGYTILDASLFSNYISCNRYSNSGYTPRGESISGGRYCNKLVVGISNDYMNSVIQHGPKSPRPNVDIKVFCNDIRTSNYFDHNDPIVGRSYMLSSDYYVCRDGSVHSGNGSCKVATEYKLKSEESKVKVCVRWREEPDEHGFINCDKRNEETQYRCIDDTTYDTGKIDLTRYDISICHQHYITDSITNINVIEIYDPNLMIN